MTWYLLILLLTIGLELAVVTVARRLRTSLRPLPIPATCFWLNLLTHPLATMARIALGVPFLPLELAVILVEAVGYQQIARVPPGWSIGLSLVANGVTMIVGLLFVP